jgi:hypothetical protein
MTVSSLRASRWRRQCREGKEADRVVSGVTCKRLTVELGADPIPVFLVVEVAAGVIVGVVSPVVGI